ncbi:hypothetical protein DFJ74DRAFT_766785 [Hyaloraphidium curvatum]|nr:hypothetical protein DFJ74DRAFT_766785 [Hyaloraphidium curvatum]
MTPKPLQNQTALVTGASSGIGLAVAHRLARLGASVTLVARDPGRLKAAAEAIKRDAPDAQIECIARDLTLMSSAAELGSRVAPPDILVHCAGLMLPARTLTPESVETVFAIQFLARYLLDTRLAARLPAGARVVSVSAGGCYAFPLPWDNLQGEKHYDGVRQLQVESVCNDMLVLEMRERWRGARWYCYGPGYVAGTGLQREMGGMLRFASATFGRMVSYPLEKAADGVVRLCMQAEEGPPLQGRMYGRKVVENRPSAFAGDPENRRKLMGVAESLVQDALARSSNEEGTRGAPSWFGRTEQRTVVEAAN